MTLELRKDCDKFLRYFEQKDDRYRVNLNDMAVEIKMPSGVLTKCTSILITLCYITIKERIDTGVNTIFYAMITTEGMMFITSTSFERQFIKEEYEMKLLQMNISTAQIQKSLLYVNRWIALATVMAAIYYCLLMLKDIYSVDTEIVKKIGYLLSLGVAFVVLLPMLLRRHQ